MWGFMWGTAASVTQAMFFLWATGLVKHLRLSLPTLSKSRNVDLISWPHSLSLSIHRRSFAVSLSLSLSLSGWMAVFSLCAWDLLGLKLTSLADLLWRRISTQRDSAANVLVRVQQSFQIKKGKKTSMLFWWTSMLKLMFSWSYTTAVHADED